MQHRHLTGQHWDRAAIASCLERGSSADLDELLAVALEDPNSPLADDVLLIAATTPAYGIGRAIQAALWRARAPDLDWHRIAPLVTGPTERIWD
jgi:hypothetical protein